MISLGLDPSLTGFGWCVHNSEAVGLERVIDRGRFITTADQIFVTRYMFMREQVGNLIKKYPEIQCVGVESPPFGELWSEGLYGLFLYVNEALYTHRRDVVYFDPGTVKMLTKIDPSVRTGKMFKTDMVEAAKVDTGFVGRFNHNEADAYHIGRFAARFWMLYSGQIQEADLTPAEHLAFLKIHTFKKGAKAGQTEKLGALFKENRRFFRFSTLELSHG